MKFLEDMYEEEKCAVIRQRGGDREHLLDILQELQNRSKQQALDPATLELVAEVLGMGRAAVMDVVGFYARLSVKPQARYVLEVCRSNPCDIRHSQAVLDQLAAKLGIGPNETTRDKMFTIRFMECAGACEMGPVIRVGDKIYGNLTPEKINDLIAGLRDRK